MKIENFAKILKQLFEERLNLLNYSIYKKELIFDSKYSFNNLSLFNIKRQLCHSTYRFDYVER